MRIASGESGVVGGHAVIAPAAAVAIVHLLRDWRRGFRGGPEEFLALDQAMDCLRVAASADGISEVSRNSATPPFGSWLTAEQVASATGMSSRWIRKLAQEGRVEAQRPNGCMVFPPDTVKRLRRASKNAH